MNSVGNPVLWGSFAAIIVVMLLVDLLWQGKHKDQPMSVKQAASWSLVWIALSMLFALGLWWYFRETVDIQFANSQTMAFLTGYLLKKR